MSVRRLKNVQETVGFDSPEERLDVRHYLAKELPEDAPKKERRLRKQAIHHLARYTWATRVLADRPPGRVLDVACGAGYGSRMLADALPSHEVVGGDHDPRAVSHAKEHYGGPANLSFRTIDIVSWTDPADGSEAGKYDYVVCFDTIEHLTHRDVCLVALAEQLEPDGALLISTPVHNENLLTPGWEHHKIEYSRPTLHNLLTRFFAEVRILDDRTLPHLDFWDGVINKGEVRYPTRGNPILCRKSIKRGLDWPPDPHVPQVEAELTRLRAEAVQAKADLAAVQGSTSWRMTGPAAGPARQGPAGPLARHTCRFAELHASRRRKGGGMVRISLRNIQVYQLFEGAWWRSGRDRRRTFSGLGASSIPF